jgi:FkbM family methyltransferase
MDRIPEVIELKDEHRQLFECLTSSPSVDHLLDIQLRNPGVLELPAVAAHAVMAALVEQVAAKAKGGNLSGRESLSFLGAICAWHETSHAQLFQDLWALNVSGGKRDGFFVEIGAADGVYLSNTLLLEEAYGWRGILVEPNPDSHAAILARRPRSRLVRGAAARVGGPHADFRVTRNPEYSTFEDYVAVDLHFESERATDFRTVDVDTFSIDDILRHPDVPDVIDYLSIDTEGSELDILEGCDLATYDIRCITVEHNWTASREPIRRHLEGKGYRRCLMEFSKWDDWYVKEDQTR